MKLPIGKPMFATFAHHTAVLSIMPPQRNWLPWFYRSYLQLIGFMNPEGFMTMDAYISIYTLSSCPWISLGSVSRESIKRQNALLDYVVESIDKGRYLYVGIDEYYLPAYSAYRKYHIPHPILIYGYDLEKRICYVADFFTEAGFSFAEATFNDLCQAFGQLQEEEPFGRTINSLSYKENPEYEADFHGLKHIVSDYANARLTANYHFDVHQPINTINEVHAGEHWIESHPGEVWYGMGVYERLLHDLRSYQSGTGLFDIRNLSTILQHKKLLSAMYPYLYERSATEKAPYMEDMLHRMEKTALLAQSSVLKFILLGKRDKEWIHVTANHIEQLAEAEKEVVSNLLYQMER